MSGTELFDQLRRECAVKEGTTARIGFSTYIGASMTTAFLTGPVGVVLLTIRAAGGLAFLGKANWRKTMAFIVAMHCLKAEALHS